MKALWRTGWQTALIVLAAAALCMAKPTTMPSPGTINYIEGQVALNGQALSPNSAGSALVETNQLLDTGRGNAEMLLTPGVFFRVGNNSEVRMVSPGLADTSVELVRGSGMLEVTELFKENNIAVMVNGATTRIEKRGLYDFNADQPAVSVLDGKATVVEGGAHVNLGKGHEALLSNSQALKSQKLNKEAVQTEPPYRWSSLRSQYEAEANINTAQTVVVNGGWYGAGWYWDPFWNFYSFLPGDGILYSPFGWGFYSPGWAWRAPHYYHYPGVGGHGWRTAPPAERHFDGGGRAAPMMAAPHFGSMGGGFHGGGGHR
jgi:hypothetical protein